MKEENRKLPRPCWWPEPITLEQYEALAPEGLEIEEGFLLGGPEAGERRVELLALLLRNCGLETAVRLADPTLWKEALDRWQLYGPFDFDHPPFSVYEAD